MNEGLAIAGNSEMFVPTTYTDGLGNVLVNAPAGSTISVYDSFNTRNQFNGGQLGIGAQYLLDRWSLSGSFKLAFGQTHQVADSNGVTTVYPVNGSPVPLLGGNYATLQIGQYSQNRFAVAPQVGLNVGYQLTPWLRATLGYQFLYLSSVLRPGNQIDNTFDGTTHPLVPMATSGFWAQGLTFGLQFSY